MPSALSYPGVYIEEISSGVRTITGVATSITAFVGYTRMGVLDKAVIITSFADFERQFGGLDRDSPVSYAVSQFFANGGTQAIIVRVANGSAKAKWVLKNAAGDALNVDAVNPGAWGNDLRLTVTRTDVRNPDSDFNLLVLQAQPDPSSSDPNAKIFKVVETHRNLNFNSTSSQYANSVVNSASTLIKVERKKGLNYANGFALSSAALAFPLNVTDWLISGSIDGSTPFTLNIKPAAPPNSVNDLVKAVSDAIANDLVIKNLLTASESDADGNAGTGHLKLTSNKSDDFSSVSISAGAFGGLAATIKLGLANGGREITGSAIARPIEVKEVVPTTSGVDGNKAEVGDLKGDESAKRGIYALLDTDLFNLLCIPETFDLSGTSAKAVFDEVMALFRKYNRRAFYIFDAPSSITKLEDIKTFVKDNLPPSLDARNAAIYFPAITIADPLDDYRKKQLAPSGTLAGIYSRTDANRGVWKAPAGTDATLNGVSAVATVLNDMENGQLNQLGINVLRNFPAFGRVAWGARTLRGADNQSDEYKYIPVRRTALFIEESLYRGTQWVVFEPNDEPLWAQIRLNVGAFMHNLFRQGAFQGSSPRDAYFVKCDKETTPQNDIDLGIVNVVVGFAPLKPAEFVVIKLQQIAGQIQV